MLDTTAPKAFCFVLMPFSDDFDDIYELGIKAACKEAGAYCERVDEQIFHESIMERVYNQISKADIIIADMTGRNPNVFYEVGYAHALGKPTILLTQRADDIPFDLKHYPHIVYGNKITHVKNELTTRVRWFIENPPEKMGLGTVGIDLYLEGISLSSNRQIFEYPENRYPSATLTIHNSSTITFEPGDVKVGILTSELFPETNISGARTVKVPSGGYIHMAPFAEKLLPQSYSSIKISLDVENRFHRPDQGHQETIIIRIFTSLGTRDFNLTLRVGPPI